MIKAVGCYFISSGYSCHQIRAALSKFCSHKTGCPDIQTFEQVEHTDQSFARYCDSFLRTYLQTVFIREVELLDIKAQQYTFSHTAP